MPVYKNGYTLSEELEVIPEVRCYVAQDDLSELAEEPLRSVIDRHHEQWYHHNDGLIINQDYLTTQ